MSRRRGFTLVELVVYLGLVATALVVFGGIEVSAQRNLSVQSALIDMENQSASYLGAFRRDVEAARKLELEADSVRVHTHAGGVVVYRAGERSELDATGKPRLRQVYPLLNTVHATREGRRVTLEARLSVELGWGKLERTFRRTASPRREVPNGG